MPKRDASGRFVKENGGGPGRPSKKREERFMEITLSSVTYKDWRDIVKKAVMQAKHGNYQARKFLAEYLIGPPAQRFEHSGPDGGPIEEKRTVEFDIGKLTDEELGALAGIAERLANED